MKTVTVLALFLILPRLVCSQRECDLKIDRDGIKVYVCSSEHDKLKSVRAEFMLENTSLDELEKHLLQVDRYPEWQYHTIEATILERVNPDEMTYRTLVDTPWPVVQREMILHFKKAKDPAHNRMDVTITSITHKYPENNNLVRVPSSTGVWDVRAVAGNSLKVVYTLRIDPGGSVPIWLVNTALADGPFTTFKKLKTILAAEKKPK